jgi:putative ABC transport system ATP-binding protein
MNDNPAGSVSPLVTLSGVYKGWYAGKRWIEILQNISLDIYLGQSLSIVGPSGAGKSTLLHVIALLTPVDRGTISHANVHENHSGKWWNPQIRRRIGMIFQDAKLLPNLNVIQNVCVPLMHRGIWPAQQKQLAVNMLERVGLMNRMGHKPNQLSGGELMRVAIARAMVIEPDLVLADEPTGTLDSKTGNVIADLLFSSVSPRQALVIVTHHMLLAQRADRMVILQDGAITDERASGYVP